MPDLKLYEPTEAERLIDRVMLAGTGVLIALEGKTSREEGLRWARELADIASRTEALLLSGQYGHAAKAR